MLRIKPAPVPRLEECVIHVASRNEAEHEQTQHYHYLLLHSGQTQHTLVLAGTASDAGGPARSPALTVTFEHLAIEVREWPLKRNSWTRSPR
ncbi:hypothetical protein SFRURICE_016161 [Spodoptera frugiperda]|nr:hypothetical protein SFRURICE_016161 [Spodoptera frugiperda]